MPLITNGIGFSVGVGVLVRVGSGVGVALGSCVRVWVGVTLWVGAITVFAIGWLVCPTGRLVAVGLGSSGFGRMPSIINKTTNTRASSNTPAPMLPQPVCFLGCSIGTAIGRAAGVDRRTGGRFRVLTGSE